MDTTFDVRIPRPRPGRHGAFGDLGFMAFAARRGGGPGGPGGFGRGHGPGDPFGGGPRRHGRRGGRRARRGDVRAAVLLLLAEEPRNGYGLMEELETRSGGLWRPSPGSVYPTLAQLEDEGLVAVTVEDGRRSFALTEQGAAYVEANRERLGAPWETAGQGATDEIVDLRQGVHVVAAAAHQVAQIGTAEQLLAATEILKEARRGLYRLLAEDPPASGEQGSQDAD